MKVLLVNGSPHKNGCTDTALREVAGALQAEGIDAEIFWIGNEPVGGCIACGGCAKAGKCVFGGTVNEFAEKGSYGLACAFASILIFITYGSVLLMNLFIKYFGTSRKLKEAE